MSEAQGPHDAVPPATGWDEPSGLPPSEGLPGTQPVPPVPFEDLEALPGFWSRVGAMFRLIFTNPLELFDRVPATEGFGAPWRFLLLMSIPSFLLAAVVFFIIGMGTMVTALEQTGSGDGRMVAAAMPIIFGALLLLMPLFTFLGMLIGGLFSHAFLWMWGGLKPGVGMGQTIRAYGYASAFIQLGAWIPTLGFLIQIAGMVVIGMGMARMHRTDTWRGVCAALTPIFLLCCCLFLAIAAAISIPALMASGS